MQLLSMYTMAFGVALKMYKCIVIWVQFELLYFVIIMHVKVVVILINDHDVLLPLFVCMFSIADTIIQ